MDGGNLYFISSKVFLFFELESDPFVIYIDTNLKEFRERIQTQNGGEIKRGTPANFFFLFKQMSFSVLPFFPDQKIPTFSNFQFF